MGYFTYPLVQDFFLKFYSIRFFRVLNAILGRCFTSIPFHHPLACSWCSAMLFHAATGGGAPFAPPTAPQQLPFTPVATHLELQSVAIHEFLVVNFFRKNLISVATYPLKIHPKYHSKHWPHQHSPNFSLQPWKLRRAARAVKKKGGCGRCAEGCMEVPDFSPWKNHPVGFHVLHPSQKEMGQILHSAIPLWHGFLLPKHWSTGWGQKNSTWKTSFCHLISKKIIDSPSVTVSLLDATLWVGNFLAPLPASYRGQWNEFVLTLLQLVNCHLIRRVRVFFQTPILMLRYMGVSVNGGIPISHPKMSICRKTHGNCWGNPPF